MSLVRLVASHNLKDTCSKPSTTITREGISEEPGALKGSSGAGGQGVGRGERCRDGSGETLTLFPLVVAEPLPLMDLCRRCIRLALGRQRLQDIGSLPLPQSLKNYLQYQ